MSLSGTLSGGYVDSKGVIQMSVEEFAVQIEGQDVQLVDVRTAEEYRHACIDGAVNIDVYEPDFLQSMKAQFCTEERLYIYCRSGVRSDIAAAMLAKEGFQTVNLLGGILAWQQVKPITDK